MRDLCVPANGLTLHVVDYGGDGPPLLLVHGTGLLARLWDPIAVTLRAHFRVLALDRRGHGDSDKPDDGYQLYHTAADIAAVITALGIEGCIAGGHSSGGGALLVCAADHPGMISRVALADPILFPRREVPAGGPPPANPMAERTRKRRATWESGPAMCASLSEKFPFDGWRPDILQAYVDHGTATAADGSVTLKCPPAIEARMYQHDGTIDLFAKLAAFAGPVLILRGANTDRFPRLLADRAQAVASDCTVLDVPNTTHFLPMEQPATVADLFGRFFRDEPVTLTVAAPTVS